MLAYIGIDKMLFSPFSSMPHNIVLMFDNDVDESLRMKLPFSCIRISVQVASCLRIQTVGVAKSQGNTTEQMNHTVCVCVCVCVCVKGRGGQETS